MPESEQPATNPVARPMGRPTVPSPVQRGSYGIPPRPMSRPAGQAPRFMDVSAPSAPAPAPVRPPQPQPVAQAAPIAVPSPQPVVASTPVQPVIPAAAPVASQSPRPLFATAPEHQASHDSAAKKSRRWHPKMKIVILVMAVLLSVLGIGRWVTAGSTAGHIIAVGAVSANDGRNMTIQFTANDGIMHKLTEKSEESMIPGSALQVAYRSGAPQTTAKQVAVIQAGRDLGRNLFLGGLFLAVIYGVIIVIEKARKQKASTLTTPVTV